MPQLCALTLLICLAHWLLPTAGTARAMAVGSLVYLAYSFLSRRLIARHHRQGVEAFHSGNFNAAIRHFEQSISFFERHPWVDRYRAITMMSPSVWSYREMGQLNKASALAKSGDHKEAIACYKKLLLDYPGNEMAARSLIFLTCPEQASGADENSSANTAHMIHGDIELPAPDCPEIVMEAAGSFAVDWGKTARTLVYQDDHGMLVFTFDFPDDPDPAGIRLEHDSSKLDSSRYHIAYNRVRNFLIDQGRVLYD